jgi:hypothetical protein
MVQVNFLNIFAFQIWHRQKISDLASHSLPYRDPTGIHFYIRCPMVHTLVYRHEWLHSMSKASLTVSEHGRGGMRGPKSSRDGNMKECRCHNFSNIGDDIWIDAFLMPPIPIVLRCSFLFLFARYYSISKLLSLLIFLFIFDHSSYSKFLKKYHIFCYNLFY